MNNIVSEYIKNTVSDTLKDISPELDFFFKKDKDGLILNSKTLQQKIVTAFNILQCENSTFLGKIRVSNFICNQLYGSFILSKSRTNIIVSELANVVHNSEYLVAPLRLYYLRFKNEDIAYTVSTTLFENGVRDVMSNVLYFQILKYILKSSFCDKNTMFVILDEFDSLFNNEDVMIYTKMDIADTFILNDRVIRGNEMLNELRHREAILLQHFQPTNHTIRTVYSDTQNVHDSNINESVLKACIHLIYITNCPSYFDPQEVTDALPNSIEVIRVLERIEIDTSRFQYGNDAFNLYNLFSALWEYIKSHENKDELLNRLLEEIISMEKYCSSGHISRFINVIQGYSNDDKLYVRISDLSQIKAVLTNYLDKTLITSSDIVQESIIEDNKTHFYNFITDRVNEKMQELLIEYGDVQEHILTSIRDYSQWKYWGILNNQIFIKQLPDFKFMWYTLAHKASKLLETY